MFGLLSENGFFGTGASLGADLSLVLVIISAILFITGWRVARKKGFKNHHWIQSSATVINLLAVVLVMIPSFKNYILPGLPEKLFQETYGITTFHALLGAITTLFGIYVVLASSKWLPKAIRFKNFKPWMITSFILYMLATLGGLTIYYLTYMA